MKGFYKKILCVALSMTLAFSINCSFFTSATNLENTSDVNANKISDALVTKFNGVTPIQVAIWFENTFDVDAVKTSAMTSVCTAETMSATLLKEMSVSDSIQLADNDIIDKYISKKNKDFASAYQKQNTGYIQKYLKDEKIVFMSSLSPMVVVELSPEKISRLAKEQAIKYLDYYNSDAKDGTLQSVLTLLKVPDVQNYGYTGAGIKIGQVESGVPDDSVSNVVARYGDAQTDHATSVASIINAVAPDASIYSASFKRSYTVNGITYSGSIEAASEWLIINHDINILNLSCHHYVGSQWDTNKYDAYCRWADHIAIVHDIHVVCAVGNDGDCGEHYTYMGVPSPGMAYNAIAVGNLDYHGTSTLSDDTLNLASSYYDGTLYSNVKLAYKPDISAPGTFDLGEGTSYSAPFVTGAIALLCEQRPALKILQNTVKAILLAATNEQSPHYYVPSNWSATASNNYSHYGAGILNCKNAYVVAYYSRYYNSDFSPSEITACTPQTYSFTVTSGMTYVRVALNWLKTTTDCDINSAVSDPSIPNLNLYVYRNNQLVASSACTSGNVEIVGFDPRDYGSGTYTVKIIPAAGNYSTPTTNTYYAVAWW